MKLLLLIIAVFFLFVATPQAWGKRIGAGRSISTIQRSKKNETTPQRPTEPAAAQKYFTDVELMNQDGQKMRLYSDLLKGRTVAIISFFTTCTNICPPMNATMSRMQKELGDRVGREVYLISVSVDPVTDTPERLKAYAAKFHATDGWYFLTGKPENVNLALRKLGQYVADKNDHSSIMIIGNEATGLWKKAFALAPPTQLVKIVEEVAGDKGND